MFEEPEWVEAAPAVVGLHPATTQTRPATAPPVKGRKRRHLLATLRTLEAASLSRKSPSPPGSDSEEEEVGRKNKYLQRTSLANASKEVGEKRKRKCQKQVSSVSDSEDKEVERKCLRQTSLGGISTEEEKGKRKCQKYSHSHPTQPLDSVGQTVHNSRTSIATIDPSKPSPESTSCNSLHTLSRKQWRNRQKNKRRHKNKFRPLQTPEQVPSKASAEETETLPAPASDDLQARAGALRARMTQRLDGARFRYLNEQLYSGPSSAAQRLFQEDPEAFLLYHRGFQKQVKKWPLHPVDRIAKDLRQKPASLVVADFGCGDCRLASSVRNPVHCFDLASLDPRVTVCDMAQVPLEDESVDVAVFCLSLMGTNIRDFLEEANRVLKPGGLLKVAEVSSRFEDIRTFLGAVTKLGFKVIYKDLTNSHFFLFDFEKTGPPRVGPKAQLSGLKLQPCLYKRR
ncbi:ribosomal RNA-processing protein 8 [Chionomys nivalis]|uniref:ribosomal RNA-processing protein 8 n=1 Tax=Chionomys nivalis TaxID=269649 RepID=UPI00259184B0|nr:ribosomal RNA-processing protein 8 [Chionomys nivalis]